MSDAKLEPGHSKHEMQMTRGTENIPSGSESAQDAGRVSQPPSFGLPDSRQKLDDKYPWITNLADELIDEWVFDTRSANALKRGAILTWSDLGACNEQVLFSLPNVGTHTVRRIHEALDTHGPVLNELASEKQSLAVIQESKTETNKLIGVDLGAAAAWASVVTDYGTLGDLVDVYRDGATVPHDVRQEVEALFAIPLARLYGQVVPSLDDQLEALLAQAADPELLIVRECSRIPPTLELLGAERGVTRERVRQKVAKDVDLIHDLVRSGQFRSVEWAIEHFSKECGTIIPAEDEIVRRWMARVGELHFEVLRWLSDYRYDEDWLVRHTSIKTVILTAINEIAGSEWLINADDLKKAITTPLSTETLLERVGRYCPWRPIGDGWLVRWDGSIQEKAERVLALVGKPMTPAELVKAIGFGSEGTIKNKPRSLVRVDKQFRLALPEWGYEEYEGITTEIRQRIERGGGVASRAAIIEEFTDNFGVSISSILTYLNLPIFNIDGDAVRLVDALSFTPQPPSTVFGAVRTQQGWGGRLTVTEDTGKGYSLKLSPHIAWANGIRPEDSLRIPVNGSTEHTASVIWRTTNPSGDVEVGRLRRWLAERGVGPGAEIVVCPSRDGVTILVGTDEIGAARRAFEAAAPAVAPEIAALMEGL